MPSQDPKSPQLEGDNDPDPFIRNEYRLARAREMGYNTDRPLYHLTKNDFNAFKLNADPTSHAGGHAIWLREDPRSNPAAHQVSDPRELYTSGARNIPVYVKHGKEVPSDVQWDLKQQGKLNGSFPIVVHKHENEMLRGMGYTHARTPGGEWAMLDPQPIRSTFARFDPSEANSDDIMKKTGGAINPEKAIRAANMIARRVGRAPGGSLSDAMNSFSKEREDSLKRPASGSTASDAALLAMLRPHPQLVIAEPEDSRRRMAPSGQAADLGAQIDEGAHWLAGEPAEDDSIQTSNSSVASGHQIGNSPPVVSGARQSAVRRGNGPALITTQSFEPGAAGSPTSQNGAPRPIVQGRAPSGGNPNYHYAALNNPGNIGFGSWAQSHGAVTHAGWDTGHAIAGFPDLDTGYRAMSNLALGKYSNGATSLNRLIAGTNGWTPGNGIAAENIARYMGVSPNEDLRLDNPERMRAFQRALTIQETGSSSQFDAWNHPRNQQAASATPTPQPNNPPPPQMGAEAPLQLQDSPPQTQEIPLGGPSAQATPPGPQAQADPMSNMFDRMALMPEVASGYDSPQVLYQPDQAKRGGYIRRAAGGPAYASMPTNELIARALEIIRKHRDTGGSTSLPNNGALRVSGLTEHAPNGDILLNQDLPANYSRSNNTAAWEPPIEIPSSSPAPQQPANTTPNTPAVAAGTVGNAAGATGSPIGTIPMAAPTQPPPPDWNNTLDQALQTNNPTMNQIFGFNYPQNLPSPKPQPQGPVSQDEINALYGFGGGSQMGTGTFQSGGAIIMDALNRARRAKGNKRNV